jgi:hypothetical protein
MYASEEILATIPQSKIRIGERLIMVIFDSLASSA